MMNGKLNLCVWLFLLLVLQGARGSLSRAETSFGVLDVRRDLGGSLVRSSAWISPVGESSDTEAVFSISGQQQSGWSAAAPVWNASGRKDGWYSAELQEKGEIIRAKLAVLNDAGVVLHGGVLERNEVWTADRIHLVRHWVRIPAGRTLTVEPGAVVKFCSHTGIQADGVFNASEARLTDAADDSLGGDTDMNRDSAAVEKGSYQITGTGRINAGRLSSDCFATAFAPLDVRKCFGGDIARGAVRLSPLVEQQDRNAALTMDGNALPGWTAEAPVWNSASVRDGRYLLELAEQQQIFKTGLAVLNDPGVVLRGGVLETDEVWSADKIHLVRYWVRIPEGKTLTVEAGAVVKFCRYTGIQADGVLNARNTSFVPAENDFFGGDTDMNGPVTDAEYRRIEVCGSGQVNLSGSCEASATAFERLDVRDDLGGRMIRGTERIASLAEMPGGQSSLTVNGGTAEGWTAEGQLWNSTQKADGWYPFVLTESGRSHSRELAVLNDPRVAVHAGVLVNNEFWRADRVHLIRHWVRIPEGMILTVEDGAVLKFCRYTGIQVDGVLKGSRVQMLPAEDDRLGGDTDMKAAAEKPEWSNEPLFGNGQIQLTDSAVYNGRRDHVRLALASGWNLLSLPAGMDLAQLGNRPMIVCTGHQYVFYQDRFSDGRAFWCFQPEAEHAGLDLIQDVSMINSSLAGKLTQKGCSLGVPGSEPVYVEKDVFQRIMQWNNGRFEALKPDSDGGYTFQPGRGYIVP